MQKPLKYSIFKTKWGYFGILGTEKGLLRTCLPMAKRQSAKTALLTASQSARFDKQYFKNLQKMITSYFQGNYVDFTPSDAPVLLNNLSDFAKSVLMACRTVKYGKTISYGQLVQSIGQPGAARAAGNCLSANNLPLIVPCHRVICSDGRLGGFSAPGGIKTKKKLLNHEHKFKDLHTYRRAACND
jgi:methylated-DNA-[protein]-cysteine S-methyltransferase